MLFKERASVKSVGKMSSASKRSSQGGGASSDYSGTDDIGTSVAEGASPTEEGRTVAGMRTRTLKTIVEEAHEGTEHRDTSQQSEHAISTRIHEESRSGHKPGTSPR